MSRHKVNGMWVEDNQDPSDISGLGGLARAVNSAVGAKRRSGGGTKQPNLFGLGAWAGQKVSAGNLPFPVAGSSAHDILAGAAKASAASLAQVQVALSTGGFYPKNYDLSSRLGLWDEQTRKALGTVTKLAGQSHRSVSGTLIDFARTGSTQGVEVAKQRPDHVVTVQMPNTAELENTAQKTFEQVLGRKPTANEAEAFAATYRNMFYNVTTAGALAQARAQQQAQAAADAANEQRMAAAQAQAAPPPPPARHAPAAPPVQETHPSPHQSGLFSGGQSPASGISGATDMAANAAESLGQGIHNLFAGQHSATAGPHRSFRQQLHQALPEPAEAPPPPKPPGVDLVRTESPVSPGVAAENYAERTHPTEALAASLADVFNEFEKLIGA
jgi:hypothetical protein